MSSLEQRRSDPSLLQAALKYAKNGFFVFPLHSICDGKCTCGNADCKDPGKHPRTAHGFKDATIDLRQVEEWWTRWPQSNIGVAAGPSGLFVYDVDGDEGAATLNALVAEHGALPQTKVVRTARGRHIWLQKPDGCGHIPSSTGDGLDVRADGGYVIAPPSLHHSGRRYEWECFTTLADAPAWALDWAKNRKGGGGARPSNVETRLGAPPDYLKNITSLASAKRLDGSIRPAWSPAEQASLEAALEVIPADSYETWVTIGMACQALRWETSEVDLGFQIWDQWSQSCPEKYSQAACEEKWKSFGRSGRSGITIGTIYHMAKERGWNPTSLT
jgi:hypothetical protein